MEMNNSDYVCPKCNGHLNVGNKIVFATKTKRNHKGLIMLSQAIGEYSYEHHDKYQLEKGELVDFECPVCQADLTSKKAKDHAMINIVGDEGMGYELYFSKVAGNQSTYVVAQDSIEAFGEDAIDFEDLYYEEDEY